VRRDREEEGLSGARLSRVLCDRLTQPLLVAGGCRPARLGAEALPAPAPSGWGRPGRVARAALRESGAPDAAYAAWPEAACAAWPEAACAVWPDGMRLAMPQPCHAASCHVTLSCQSCHAASASPAARLDTGCKSLEGAGVVCVPRLHERAHAHRRTLVCLCVSAHTSGRAAHCVWAYSDGRVQGAYTRRQGARGVQARSAPGDAWPRGRLGGRGLRDARGP
jgi:hypothetical protein